MGRIGQFGVVGRGKERSALRSALEKKPSIFEADGSAMR